ncbi:hypothetical protein Sango_1912800 [Sesamum angolense]|uniref:Retrotransposon gag protein n=1 Tax=Sesamum angolense TaxID=2727404 RepID=A0AAE1WJ65_9LAMI|nr:hypothetical protein Sango_1912800 [Sesamum angolense]
MASNTQQFGTRYDDPPRKSNEVSIAAFDDRLDELTSLVKKIAVERTQHVKAYCICTLTRNATDMCPTLQESPIEHAEAIGEFFGQQHRRYDPFSNTYNPGWKDHPNLSYSAQNQNFRRPQYRSHVPPPHPIPIKNLEAQMSQLASSVSKLESQGKLPSQTVVNPKQNASAIVLRSGKELQEHTDKNSTKRGYAQKRKPEKEVVIPQDQDDEAKEDNPNVLVTRPPFPERFTKSKNEEEEKEIFKIFSKVEVNIPLLDAIKQIPHYAKFLKELCTRKGKLKGNERKFLAMDDKDYIKLALEESPTPMEEGNMGVDHLVQVNAKFDGDSVFLAKINKNLTYGLRTYKNKAFHDKISSRKNSLMNIKVFIGPRHLRKHYIEEVDSECPTYSSLGTTMSSQRR